MNLDYALGYLANVGCFFVNEKNGQIRPYYKIITIKDDKKDPYNRIVEVYHLIEKDIAADFLVYGYEPI